MGIAFRRVILSIVLCTLAGILSYRTAMGQMALYIHPRYELLVYGCALVLFLFGAVSWSSPATPPKLSTIFLCIPVCIAVAFAPKPLGSAALVSQLGSLNAVVPAAQQQHDPTTDTLQWNLYEWAVASSVDVTPYAGSAAVIEGFVVQNSELDLPNDQFMLARYVLKCCTADAGGVGMRIVWAKSGQLRSDQWVRVSGTITVESSEGVPRPLIVATSVVPIEQPARPYLIP
jgi:uncharacterized repeat protein (TIGR03943 family)